MIVEFVPMKFALLILNISTGHQRLPHQLNQHNQLNKPVRQHLSPSQLFFFLFSFFLYPFSYDLSAASRRASASQLLSVKRLPHHQFPSYPFI
jgi:hypothetical protein